MKGSLSHWWAVLLDAELQSEIENHQHRDGAAALRNLRIAAQIRIKLRDEYGLNLDSIGEKARTEYLRLYQAEIQREKAEADKQRKLEALLDDIKQRVQNEGESG